MRKLPWLSAEHLCLARLWLWLGLAMLFGICLLSLTSVPAPMRSVLLHDKAMHVLAYAALMGWFSQIFRHPVTRAGLALAFIGIGVAIEYAQAVLPTRQFELLDMLANTSGIVLAWALAHTWLGKLLEWFEIYILKLSVEPLADSAVS